MLISLNYMMATFKLSITGILHVGAHECEELPDYVAAGVDPANIYWIDALQPKVDLCKAKFNAKIYQGLIDEKDGILVPFHITNNSQSSSILQFGTHANNHPDVKVVADEMLSTIRLDTLLERENIPIQHLNFINLDIQGVELRALKSMEKHLGSVHYIYTEVNSEQVYLGCDLIGEIDSYLAGFGFRRVETTFWGNCGWGDALYIKD